MLKSWCWLIFLFSVTNYLIIVFFLPFDCYASLKVSFYYFIFHVISWNISQVTLHPFVIYEKKQETLTNESFCVIYDHMKHDSNGVHALKSIMGVES